MLLTCFALCALVPDGKKYLPQHHEFPMQAKNKEAEELGDGGVSFLRKTGQNVVNLPIDGGFHGKSPKPLDAFCERENPIGR